MPIKDYLLRSFATFDEYILRKNIHVTFTRNFSRRFKSKIVSPAL